MSRRKAMPEDLMAAVVAATSAPAPITGDDTLQLVTFVLGDDEFGFHIDRVQEIIRYRSVKITQIPNAPAMIEGVINLRGRLVPTVDLRKRFDRPSEATGRSTRVVVVDVVGRTIGLVVDAVLEVVRVDRASIEPLPELASGVDSEFVEGVCRASRGLVVVLDLERMFSEQETDAIQDVAEHGDERKGQGR